MTTIKIDATMRTRYTKGEIKAARRRGRVPAAVFGRSTEPILVEIGARQLVQVLSSEARLNTPVELTVEGETPRSVIIAELKRDPITRGFLHVGFHQISSTDRIHTHVEIRLLGEPISVSQKEGVLEQNLERLEIRAISSELPAHIDYDVSYLQIGDAVHVSDLSLSPNIEVLTPASSTIAVLHHARVAIAETEQAGEAGAETPTAAETS